MENAPIQVPVPQPTATPEKAAPHPSGSTETPPPSRAPHTTETPTLNKSWGSRANSPLPSRSTTNSPSKIPADIRKRSSVAKNLIQQLNSPGKKRFASNTLATSSPSKKAKENEIIHSSQIASGSGTSSREPTAGHRSPEADFRITGRESETEDWPTLNPAPVTAYAVPNKQTYRPPVLKPFAPLPTTLDSTFPSAPIIGPYQPLPKPNGPPNSHQPTIEIVTPGTTAEISQKSPAIVASRKSPPESPKETAPLSKNTKSATPPRSPTARVVTPEVYMEKRFSDVVSPTLDTTYELNSTDEGFTQVKERPKKYKAPTRGSLPPSTNILICGDSHAAHWGRASNYSTLLKTPHNSAIPGLQTEQLLSQWKYSGQVDQVGKKQKVKYHPKDPWPNKDQLAKFTDIVISIGTNDVTGENETMETHEIIDRIAFQIRKQCPKAKVHLNSLPPRNDILRKRRVYHRKDQEHAFMASTRKLAQATQNLNKSFEGLLNNGKIDTIIPPPQHHIDLWEGRVKPRIYFQDWLHQNNNSNVLLMQHINTHIRLFHTPKYMSVLSE